MDEVMASSLLLLPRAAAAAAEAMKVGGADNSGLGLGKAVGLAEGKGGGPNVEDAGLEMEGAGGAAGGVGPEAEMEAALTMKELGGSA